MDSADRSEFGARATAALLLCLLTLGPAPAAAEEPGPGLEEGDEAPAQAAQPAPQAEPAAPTPEGAQELTDLFNDVKFDNGAVSTWSSAEEPEEGALERPLAEEPEVTATETMAVEAALERWVRELVAPFVDPRDYSVYVDVAMLSDPHRLRAYRQRAEERSLPGLVPNFSQAAEEGDHPREHPLLGLVDKKKIILVFLKPVSDAQIRLISEILRAKRVVVEAKGDVLTMNNSAAETSILDRVLGTFSFEAEEGQPAWLAPLSAFVSVSMIFAFAVLMWQVLMLRRGGQPQRLIQVAPRRARGPAAPARTASRLRSGLGSGARGLKRAAVLAAKGAAPAAASARRGAKQAARWVRRAILKQSVPPVWPPRALLEAAKRGKPRSTAAPAPASGGPVTVQVVPVGGRYPFRGLRSVSSDVVTRAFRGIEPRTLALALLHEDHDTLEWALGLVPDDLKGDIVNQAICLGRDAKGGDLEHASAQAKTRVTETVARALGASGQAGVS
ncbi:MAG: hypothetical protein IT285_12250 [Bdellovibrionales bacterium]|nr:hypothetical protein [Bdellovibrionales bacterium]